MALVNSTTDTLKTPRLRDRTDRAWFSLVTLYDIRPGNGVDLFLQPWSLHRADLAQARPLTERNGDCLWEPACLAVIVLLLLGSRFCRFVSLQSLNHSQALWRVCKWQQHNSHFDADLFSSPLLHTSSPSVKSSNGNSFPTASTELNGTVCIVSTLVVERSLLQARWSGTLYRTVSETRLSAAAASGNYLRRTCSTATQHTQRSRDAVWRCWGM